MHSSTLATPSFGPVWLKFCDFICIFKCMLVVFLGCIGSRSIGVENVVWRFDPDCLREFLTRSQSARYHTNRQTKSCLREGIEWGFPRYLSKWYVYNTYIASSKFFSAIALFPAAFNSSAMFARVSLLEVSKTLCRQVRQRQVFELLKLVRWSDNKSTSGAHSILELSAGGRDNSAFEPGLLPTWPNSSLLEIPNF